MTEHTKPDYPALLTRIKNGEKVPCTVLLHGRTLSVRAGCINTIFGDLYEIYGESSLGTGIFKREAEFIEFCEKLNLKFVERDFLKDTRKLLELAQNAAEFVSIRLPLNTAAEVEELLLLLDNHASSV
jgi:hypothetical protein